MSGELYAFKVGDRVVLACLGPDQSEGVVTRINAARTFPSFYTVSVVFEPGKAFASHPAAFEQPAKKPGYRLHGLSLSQHCLFPRHPVSAARFWHRNVG
jgi:hypothetical protein